MVSVTLFSGNENAIRLFSHLTETVVSQTPLTTGFDSRLRLKTLLIKSLIILIEQCFHSHALRAQR